MLTPAPAKADLSEEFFKFSDILCAFIVLDCHFRSSLKKHNSQLITTNPGPNEGEAEVLSGRSVSTQEDAVQAVEPPCQLPTPFVWHSDTFVLQARVLVDKGVKQVVITLGSRGCLVVDKESSHLLPAPKVEPVDTTGAGASSLSFSFFHSSPQNDVLIRTGDCFVGSMLFFLARGKSLIDACTLATQVAGLGAILRQREQSVDELIFLVVLKQPFPSLPRELKQVTLKGVESLG